MSFVSILPVVVIYRSSLVILVERRTSNARSLSHAVDLSSLESKTFRSFVLPHSTPHCTHIAMSLSSFELPAVLLAINRSSILAVGLPILLGFGSGFITRSSIPTWYRPLIKPPGEPPRLTFPIAWTLLYASMGLASHFLVKAYDNASPGSGKPAMNALELYWIQYALNLAWTPVE
jgi:hypothetical protein